MSAKINSLTLGALAVIAALLFSGCTNLAPGYRALVIVKEAGDQTGKTMAAACKTKRLACEAEHSTDKVLLKACLAPCLDALRAWVRVAKPAIRSAQLAAWAALETAYAAKSHDAPWLAKLKPGACALIRILKQWEGLAGEKFKAIARTVVMLEGLVCK